MKQRIRRPTEELKPNNISVYPNPANESLTIFNVTTNDQSYSVELIDITGRIVYAKLLSNNIIRTENIQNGSYVGSKDSSKGKSSSNVKS